MARDVTFPVRRAIRLIHEATDECLDDLLVDHGGDCRCDRCLELAVIVRCLNNATRDLQALVRSGRNGRNEHGA